MFKERRELRTVSKASPTASLGSVRPVTESPLAVAIVAPKRWWRTLGNEGVNDAPRGARKGRRYFLWLFNSGQSKQQVTQQVKRWSGAPCHSLIIVPGNQTFIERKPARRKPFLSVGSLKTTLLRAFLWFIMSIFVMTPPAAESMLQRYPQQRGTGAASTASGQGPVCKRMPQKRTIYFCHGPFWWFRSFSLILEAADAMKVNPKSNKPVSNKVNTN